MLYKIQVSFKKGYPDKHGEHIKHSMPEIGLHTHTDVNYSPLYRIEGEITSAQVELIASELLVDRITEAYEINPESSKAANKHEVEVWFKHGVTDTVADSVAKAIKDLGIDKELKINTAHKYTIIGDISKKTLEHIAERLLCNTMVQKYLIV